MPYCAKEGRWCFRAVFLRRERFRVNGRVAACSLECAERWASARGDIAVAASCVSGRGRTLHTITTKPLKDHVRNAESYRPEKKERPP